MIRRLICRLRGHRCSRPWALHLASVGFACVRCGDWIFPASLEREGVPW